MLSKLAYRLENDFGESMKKQNVSILWSIETCRKQLAKQPKNPELFGSFHSFLQVVCDWSDYEDRLKKLSRLADKHLRDNVKPPVVNGTWSNLYPLSLQQQLGIAAYFSQLGIPKSPPPAIEYQLSGERLRIGYIGTGDGTFPLLKKGSLHNWEKFEVFYYNCAVDTPASVQTDDQSTNEHLVDLTKFCSNEAAAKRIASDGIQILVNLDMDKSSHKDDEFSTDVILALRPAPIQVVYRSSRGTTGAPWVDYFITDKVASPLNFAYGYSEKLAYMPNGMFVCDEPELLTKSQENPKERDKHRQRCRLPESAIVFAVKSEPSKIDPDIFECWCEILRRVPKSVLWLLNPYYDQAQVNLKREAKRHKINPDRLLFYDEGKYFDLTVIDVILETPLCNCHCANMIMPITCGIPIVTLPRQSFVSRLTASLLTSISCGELIAKSTWEYVQIAVNLGNKPELLAEMKAKMSGILPDSNLFATDRYFGDLEDLYEQMWKWREMGEKPEHLVCGNLCPLPCLL